MKTFLLVLKLQLLGKVGVPCSVGEVIFLVLSALAFFSNRQSFAFPFQ